MSTEEFKAVVEGMAKLDDFWICIHFVWEVKGTQGPVGNRWVKAPSRSFCSDLGPSFIFEQGGQCATAKNVAPANPPWMSSLYIGALKTQEKETMGHTPIFATL